jgi:cell wall integrity and stress response component
MKSYSLAAIALSSATAVMAASTTSKGVPVPSALPMKGALRSQGCWAGKGDTWELVPTLEYPSSGSCSDYCTPLNYTVIATHAEECFCGDDYPPEDKSVDDSKCNYPCPGFDPEACGGIGSPATYGVYNTGVKIDVPFADDSTTTSSGSSSTPTATNTESTTESSQATTTDGSDGESGGSNTVGIAVGVVVGLVLFAGAIGAGYFYMRKKKRQEEAEERRRAQAVSAFVGGGSKPGSINGSFADSRLDPVMAHRRMSDGSIADNEDYSRKILRVTNA